MNTNLIALDAQELALVSGGVTMSPDGRSCTDVDMPGTLTIEVKIQIGGTTIEIDPSI